MEDVIGVVFEDLTGVLDQALDGIPFEDVLGSKEYNATDKALVSWEGRTPLIRALDDRSANTLGLAFGLLLKWPAGGTGFVAPEDYSTKAALDTLLPLLGIDLDNLLNDLILGTPADEEAGTEATEGILTAELKGQLNDFLLGVVKSMGTDDNYPEDNNTTISYEWNLLTNRTALDEAIAKAEKVDLSKYTEETADAVSEALASAKALSLTATQEEMDAAEKALNDAAAALEAISSGEGDKPGEDTNQSGENTNKPGEDTNEFGENAPAPDNAVNNPQTGNNRHIALWLSLLFIAGTVIIGTTIYGRNKQTM